MDLRGHAINAMLILLLTLLGFTVSDVASDTLSTPYRTKQLDSYEYLFIYDLRTWAGASADCKARGATLASIHSDTENQLLVDTCASLLTAGKDEGCWIGLNDINVEGEYSWTDTTDFNYSNWYQAPATPTLDSGATQPNDASQTDDEDCVFVGSRFKPAAWHDRICNATYWFICKRGIAASPPIMVPTASPSPIPSNTSSTITPNTTTPNTTTPSATLSSTASSLTKSKDDKPFAASPAGIGLWVGLVVLALAIAFIVYFFRRVLLGRKAGGTDPPPLKNTTGAGNVVNEKFDRGNVPMPPINPAGNRV